MVKHIRNRAEWSDKTVSQKGFTLIELLVVIAILGILAVVGVLSFGGLTGGAKSATAKTERSEVQSAVDAYAALSATNAYPASGDIASLVTGKELKTATLQCSYTWDATGTVSFAAAAQQTTDGHDPATCV
jgi:type IV pilus assembly protein PilA